MNGFAFDTSRATRRVSLVRWGMSGANETTRDESNGFGYIVLGYIVLGYMCWDMPTWDITYRNGTENPVVSEISQKIKDTHFWRKKSVFWHQKSSRFASRISGNSFAPEVKFWVSIFKSSLRLQRWFTTTCCADAWQPLRSLLLRKLLVKLFLLS